ncbi:MAG: DNA alkylation repair protein, partial [bacterium]|nr:DNA alkylation repair protein [bacterium]
MARLRSLGSDSIRKTWTRHGVTAKAFGVRYGDMYKLVKEIGVDHSLARALWTTKNHDARVLAMMVADPSATTATELDTWAKELD